MSHGEQRFLSIIGKKTGGFSNFERRPPPQHTTGIPAAASPPPTLNFVSQLMAFLDQSAAFWLLTSILCWFAEFGLRTAQNLGLTRLYNAAPFFWGLGFTQGFASTFLLGKMFGYAYEAVMRYRAWRSSRLYIQRYSQALPEGQDLQLAFKIARVHDADACQQLFQRLEKHIFEGNHLIQGAFVFEQNQLHYWSRKGNASVIHSVPLTPGLEYCLQAAGIHTTDLEADPHDLPAQKAYQMTYLAQIGPENIRWGISCLWMLTYAITTATAIATFFFQAALTALFPPLAIALPLALRMAQMLPVLVECVSTLRESQAYERLIVNPKVACSPNAFRKRTIKRCSYALKIILCVAVMVLYVFPGLQVLTIGLSSALTLVIFSHDFLFVPAYNRYFAKDEQGKMTAGHLLQKMATHLVSLMYLILGYPPTMNRQPNNRQPTKNSLASLPPSNAPVIVTAGLLPCNARPEIEITSFESAKLYSPIPHATHVTKPG